MGTRVKKSYNPTDICMSPYGPGCNQPSVMTIRVEKWINSDYWLDGEWSKLVFMGGLCDDCKWWNCDWDWEQDGVPSIDSHVRLIRLDLVKVQVGHYEEKRRYETEKDPK